MILQAGPLCKRPLAKQAGIWYDALRIQQLQKGVEGCAIPCKRVSEQAFPARALPFCAGALFCFAQSGVSACPCGGGGRAAFPFLRLCTGGCPAGPARVRLRPSGGRRASGAGRSAAKPRGMRAAPRLSLFSPAGAAQKRAQPAEHLRGKAGRACARPAPRLVQRRHAVWL